MAGVFAYGTLFIINEYNLEQNKDNVMAKLLELISNPPYGLCPETNQGECIVKNVGD